MNVAVVGLGFSGLSTAALLAAGGHAVCAYDTSSNVRRTLRAVTGFSGEPCVYRAVEQALALGDLRFVERIPAADAYIIGVPAEHLEETAGVVARAAPPGSILALESIVAPGTTERIFEAALRGAHRSIDGYHVAYCPQRVTPGAFIRELRSNPRIIGGRTREDALIVRDLYASFCTAPISLTTTIVAEVVKNVENAYREVNIAFANELAIFCEEFGVDVWETISLANAHPCVDVLSPAPDVRSDLNPIVTDVIQAARRVNERMPYHLVAQIGELVGPGTGQKIAILGAPAMAIDALLRERGYEAAIYDPIVRTHSLPLCDTLRETVADAHALVLLAAHHVFSRITPSSVGPLMRARRLVDTRNFFDTAQWRKAGFDCYTLGRPFERRRHMELV